MYGFNGQEKSNEIKGEGNSYTAQFWEYDPRLVRRWNVDPKPNISFSPYNCFAGNPIWYNDTKGDTLDIPASTATTTTPESNARRTSENDIYSLLRNQNNKQYIQIDRNGRVSIDFKKFGPLDLGKALTTDKGFALLYNMITEPQFYYYSATQTTDVREHNLTTGATTGPTPFTSSVQHPPGSVINGIATLNPLTGASNINRMVQNLANTLRGDEAQQMNNVQQMPGRYIFGKNKVFYDGQVTLARGQTYNLVRGNIMGFPTTLPIVVPRASIVFHELLENYYRVNGYNYPRAHAAARKDEGTSFGNPYPGSPGDYFKVDN
jgi:hypothetical protein